MIRCQIRSNKLWACGIVSSVALLLCGCMPQPSARLDPRAPGISTFVADCAATQVCNGSYLVAQGERIIFAAVVGHAGDPARTPLTTAHSFDIGSISKQMTAVAVLRLVESGRLRLEDAVADHLPDFPYRDITVAQLLSHTSGMPDILGRYAADLRSLPTGSVIDGADVIDRYATLNLPAEAPPGTRYRYNNSGYLVLANLVEQTSGEGFARHLESSLFTPLGMTQTRLRTVTNEPALSPRALGFDTADDGTMRAVDQIPGFYVRGAGGVYSTAADLLRWQRALGSGRLMSSEMWRRATTPVALSDGTTSLYGYGVSLRPLADGTARIFHSGHWRGFKSDLSYFPQTDITVIQLTNNSEDDSVDENAARLFQLASASTQ